LILRQTSTSLLFVLAAATLQHLVCLALNAAVAVYLLRLQPPEAVAVLIMSSQKSAPVAVTVISYISHNLAHQGLMAIPCVIGQLTQIFVGSALARQLAIWVDSKEVHQAVLGVGSGNGSVRKVGSNLSQGAGVSDVPVESKRIEEDGVDEELVLEDVL
jgi:hypothetical protein